MLERWETVTDDLLRLQELDVADGYPPAPLLAGYAGHEPLAVVSMRPFAPGELLQPVVELLSLLVPLGADRVAIALPGRAWSLDDPTAGEVAGRDLRARVVAVTTVDAHGAGTPTVRSSLHPYGRDDHGREGWLPCDLPDDLGPVEGPSIDALTCLLGGRDRLPTPSRTHVAVRFARCLLRGHGVVLAPAVAASLEAATAAASDA